jgi:hypothetical protein
VNDFRFETIVTVPPYQREPLSPELSELFRTVRNDLRIKWKGRDAATEWTAVRLEMEEEEEPDFGMERSWVRRQ